MFRFGFLDKLIFNVDCFYIFKLLGEENVFSVFF